MKPVKTVKNLVSNAYGRVAVPILLYLLGMPFGFVVLVWFFFFRGK
jgi:hypothetical protein